MIFIAIVILYQLIPQLSSSNATVQASANATAMAKFAAGLGEWMFPLLGIIAVVFLLFKGKSGSGV
jgi:type II secretory pathway component PulF